MKMKNERQNIIISVCMMIVFILPIWYFNLITTKPDYSDFSSSLKSIDPNKYGKSDKAVKIREAFRNLWQKYKKETYGSDKIADLTRKGVNDRFQVWGATLVDSLTTLWIMDLKDEFNEAIDHIKKIDFRKSKGEVLLFKSVIRSLGGLISAYDLSGDLLLLERTIQLADSLIPAFDTRHGLPSARVDLKTKQPVEGTVILAEIGSIQLEFSRLTEITGNPIYREKAYKVYDRLDSLVKNDGLYPTLLDSNSGDFLPSIATFGSRGDSFYEYLLKSYIMDKNPKHLEMFEESMVGLKKLLVKEKDGHLYLGESSQGFIDKKMDHLSFSVPAMLTLASNVTNNSTYLDDASKLADSIYRSYNSSATGLGPEEISFSKKGIKYTGPINKLRPELLESLYYLYKFTGDLKYQDWTWIIFLAFEKYSKSRYGQVRDVKHPKKGKEDDMESFFFAGPFKYLYLSFMPREFIDMNEWVFNTEAHPLKIKK